MVYLSNFSACFLSPVKAFIILQALSKTWLVVSSMKCLTIFLLDILPSSFFWARSPKPLASNPAPGSATAKTKDKNPMKIIVQAGKLSQLSYYVHSLKNMSHQIFFLQTIQIKITINKAIKLLVHATTRIHHSSFQAKIDSCIIDHTAKQNAIERLSFYQQSFSIVFYQ